MHVFQCWIHLNLCEGSDRSNWLVAPSRSPNSFIRAKRWTMNDDIILVWWILLCVRRSMINTQRRIFHHTFFPRSVSLAHTLYSTQSLTAECQKKWIYRFSYTYYLAFLCVHKSGYISLSLCFFILARLWVQWKFIDFNCNWDSEFGFACCEYF